MMPLALSSAEGVEVQPVTANADASKAPESGMILDLIWPGNRDSFVIAVEKHAFSYE